ncbi:MAG TPA: hypothetical protein VG742_14635 [Dongiaceae bacterium]|nr:hypothetical protein [Dongiaceae bacterium]
MHWFRAGAFFVAMLGAFYQPAAAQDSDPLVFTHGNWGGYRYGDPGKGGCYIEGKFSENYMGIVLNDDYSVVIYLSNDSWNLPQDASYPVEYWIDQGYRYRATAKVYDQRTVDIDVVDDFDVFRLLQDGRLLTVLAQGRDFYFGLKGTRGALTKALQCVQTTVAKSQPSSNPFAAAPAAPATAATASLWDNILPEPSITADSLAQFIADQIDLEPQAIYVDPAIKPDWWHYSVQVPGGYGIYWEEETRGRSAREIAAQWLNSLQGECQQDVAIAMRRTSTGPKGSHAAGVISCQGDTEGRAFSGTLNVLHLSSPETGDEGVALVILSFVESAGDGAPLDASNDALGNAIAEYNSNYVQRTD